MLALGQVESDDSHNNGVGEAARLVVATKESPPFSFRGANGQWTGISVELWRHMANELGLEYEFREMSLGPNV